MKSRRGPRQLIPGDERILCDPMFAHLPLAQVKSPGLGNGSDLFSSWAAGLGDSLVAGGGRFFGGGPGCSAKPWKQKKGPKTPLPLPFRELASIHC